LQFPKVRGFKTKAEFINNERRLNGQELSNDDNRVKNQIVMGCDIKKYRNFHPNNGYVDVLQKYKADRIVNILGECRTIKLIEIIADTKWIHYTYLRWFINVKPKTKRR